MGAPNLNVCPFPLPDPSACNLTRQYRTIDGSCNNLQHPTWGKAMRPFRRLLFPDYGDGRHDNVVVVVVVVVVVGVGVGVGGVGVGGGGGGGGGGGVVIGGGEGGGAGVAAAAAVVTESVVGVICVINIRKPCWMA